MSTDVPCCPLCDEPVWPKDLLDARPIGGPDGVTPAHRECLLRTVVGGIGHLENHALNCLQLHDPDGGRTFRQSALEVDAWVHERGTSSQVPS